MLIHIASCLIFIAYLDLGLYGASLATNVTFILNLVFAEFVLAKSESFVLTRMPVIHQWR
jgi:Na+-driven multidrug efflux pump